METNSESIDRFCSHFQRQIHSVGVPSEPPQSDLSARILLTSILDTFAKIASGDTEDRIPAGKRFTSFIREFSGWDTAIRVSVLHLARALQKQGDLAFSELESWVGERLLTALPPVPLPASFVQHPDVIQRSITVDPTLEETKEHWPKSNGRLRPLTLATIRLCPSHFTHAELLWRYRCYLVHEFRIPGGGWDVTKVGDPYYENVSEVEWETERSYLALRVITRRWELVYPLGFLRERSVVSLDNLRQKLKKEDRNPYMTFKSGSFWLSILN